MFYAHRNDIWLIFSYIRLKCAFCRFRSTVIVVEALFNYSLCNKYKSYVKIEVICDLKR